MTIEAMKQALEALKLIDEAMPFPVAKHAMSTLLTAIAEAEKQEPFGYFQYAPHFDAWVQNRDSNTGVAFYTTPSAAQRKPLSLQERTKIVRANKMYHDKDEIDAYGVIDDVEAAHGIKEKNT